MRDTSFQGTQRSVFIMAQRNILNSYEELVAYVSEVQDSLDILHEWLSVAPDLDKPETYLDLITQHSSHWALLNLIRHRLNCLTEEHGAIVREEIRTGACNK